MTDRDFYGSTSEPDVDHDVRCRYCHALLAVFVGRPWRFRCRKCKAVTQSPDAEAYVRSRESSPTNAAGGALSPTLAAPATNRPA